MARKPATANLMMSHQGDEMIAAQHHVSPESNMERLIRKADDADVNRGQSLKGLSDEELLAAFR